MKKSKNKQNLFDLKKNSKLVNFFHNLIAFLIVIFLSFLLLNSISAQVIAPTAKDVKVSATIPDTIPPSTPILINPEDGANLDMGYPVFQWYESTDNKGVSHYQFILDGRLWFDNIPLTDFANDDYSLDYDSLSGIYTLVAKNALDHGSYDWQIVAWDYGDNQAASTIWSFNIFIDDPELRIVQVGDVRVAISSTNPDSVPEQAIELFLTSPGANEPWIVAFGDPNLEVDLELTIPNRPSQFYSQDTDEEGNWALQLGILPRDQVIRLDFTITDVVGHVSYIENLYIIISQHYWPATPVPPLTMTPSLVPTVTISTTPPISSPSGTISPTVSMPTLTPTVTPLAPTIAFPTPRIKIPIVPPKEVVHQVMQEFKQSLPSKIATLITDLSRSEAWKKLSRFIALILVLLLPIVTYILVLLKFNPYFSFKALKLVFLALWPWSRRRKHLVFEYQDTQAVPLVRIELIDAESKEIVDWQISNYLGQFPSFAWPEDRPLLLKVLDNNFYFPIGGDKPVFLSWHNFYQEEAFSVGKNTFKKTKNYNPQRALAIPTLLAQGKYQLPAVERLRIILCYLLSYPWWFWLITLVPISLFVLRYPNFFNYLALLYYFVIAIIKYVYRSGNKTWQFRASFSNGYRVNQNLVLLMDDLKKGLSQAQVVTIDEGLSNKINLREKNLIFSLQTRDYVLWDGQGAVSEAEFIVNQELINEFKLHLIDAENAQLKNLQPRCQLLPRQ
jgi:hypothetical protein